MNSIDILRETIAALDERIGVLEDRYACIGSQVAEIADLKARVQEVREKHSPFPLYPHVDVCNVDSHPYPCPTIRAIDGDDDE